jgi:hypothetical protein
MKKRLCQDFKIAAGVRVSLEASLRIDQTYLKFFILWQLFFQDRFMGDPAADSSAVGLFRASASAYELA